MCWAAAAVSFLALASAALPPELCDLGAPLEPAPGPGARTCCDDWKETTRGKEPWRAPRVQLVWGSAPARAAAAVLRAALVGAGYRPDTISLHEDKNASRITDLVNVWRDGPSDAARVVLAAAAGAEGRWPAGLQALAPGAAPAAARALVRLRAASPACRAAAAALPYRLDHASLRSCSFLAGDGEVGGEVEGVLTVYSLAGEWGEQAESRVREQLPAGASLRVRRVTRADLALLVAGADHSFLFYDADLWADEARVQPLSPRAPPASLLAVKRDLVKQAPILYNLLVERNFAPNATDLRTLLALPAADLQREACARAPSFAAYKTWRNYLSSPNYLEVMVVYCDNDSRNNASVMTEDIERLLDATTGLDALHSNLYVKALGSDCDDADSLRLRINDWAGDGHAWRTVGVAAPAELVEAAALAAADHAVPLLAYTPAPDARVRSTAGDAARLGAALRRVLTAYGWRRAGLVSEDSALARGVAAALRSGTEPPVLREESAADPDAAVKALYEEDTRVFIVNTGAATAARVLAAAERVLNSTQHDAEQHVWIVRDYEAGDAATAALRPLAVTCQWRGAGATAPGRQAPLPMASHWPDGAWPRHAAAMVDAVMALSTGFERLITAHPAARDNLPIPNKLEHFWQGVENQSIPGVNAKMTFGEGGVQDAPVYLYRWGEAAHPTPLDERLQEDDLRPLSDGRPGCVVPTADPYSTRCHDAAVFGSAAALLVALAALATGAVAARRWLTRRDRRLRHATTAHILAQREAAFAELGPHLVPRAALVLDGEELGAGRFGCVQRGEVRAAGRRPAVVAVKTLRAGTSPAEESQFLHEARLLAALSHEHVVRFAGVCWEGGPPLLLMELAVFGDLLRYLRARRHLADGAGSARGDPEAGAVSAAALTRLAREAAEALAYLGARGLVHRDVRAANCLVDARRSLRLADFGLARETGAADGEYACRGRALFPVLWMAPESLARGVATAASDAWSFGVLALELVTLGARPFGGAAPEAAARAVLAGGRPPLPRDASAETRALALACWRREPGARPAAARLAAWLARRSAALRPALAADLDEDCDSGIGESEPRAAAGESELRAAGDGPAYTALHPLN